VYVKLPETSDKLLYPNLSKGKKRTESYDSLNLPREKQKKKKIILQTCALDCIYTTTSSV
jgi:hypothetical protein